MAPLLLKRETSRTARDQFTNNCLSRSHSKIKSEPGPGLNEVYSIVGQDFQRVHSMKILLAYPPVFS
jgi:hypothetical protein